MEEGQVSIDGETWLLPNPHLVLATQNPIGQLGTYRWSRASWTGSRFHAARLPRRADRDPPRPATRGAERTGGPQAHLHARRVAGGDRGGTPDPRRPAVAQYAVALARATREAPLVRLGASPRASINLVQSAQAHALLYGRNYASPIDVQAMAGPSLSHRLLTEVEGQGHQVVADALASVPAPRRDAGGTGRAPPRFESFPCPTGRSARSLPPPPRSPPDRRRPQQRIGWVQTLGAILAGFFLVGS